MFVLFCVATLLIGKDACLATVSTDDFILVDCIIVQSTVQAFVFRFFFCSFFLRNDESFKIWLVLFSCLRVLNLLM